MNQKIEDLVRTDLSSFGYGEKKRAAELLTAYAKNPDILDDKVTVAFDKFSDCVFLTEEDFGTTLMNSDILEEFFSCPGCGVEGFQEEFDKDSDCDQCREIARSKWN